MKTLLRLGILLLCLSVLMGCKEQEPQIPESIQSFTASNNGVAVNTTGPATATATTNVFVCKSSGAKKYHYDQDCQGLKRCKHEIVEMKVKDAENRGLGMCGYEN